MSEFRGWAAFSVYGVEGEDGAIYLSANGINARVAFTTPMGRALSQLAAIQREAARLPDSPSVSQDEPDYKSLFLSVREALEPFARHAERYPEGYPDNYVPTNRTGGPRGDSTVTLGDFRRASTALSVGGGGGSSSASRAAMGSQPHVATEAEPSAAGATSSDGSAS